MEDGKNPRDDPEYLIGLIESTRALVLAVAGFMPKEEFQASAIQRLESLRTGLLATTASDPHLQAVDDTEDWLRRVTSD